MKLVVGLGNPGPKYETTRHNVGFLALDRLIERWKAQGPVAKFNGEIYQAKVGGEPVILVKPRTFMNLSGRCVGPLFGFYKCAPSDLLVLHDELDIKPFTLRIKTGGGPGGHNGVRSLDEHLGQSNINYHRIRIGVGRPEPQPDGQRARPVVDYVLDQFSDKELEILDPLLDKVAEATELLLKNEVARAQNLFNR